MTSRRCDLTLWRMEASIAIAVVLTILGLGGLIYFYQIFFFSISHKIRGFFKFLRAEYGIDLPGKRLNEATTVKGLVGGNSLSASIQTVENGGYARIIISGDGFLPDPLQIRKRARQNFPQLMGPGGEEIPLAGDDFIALRDGDHDKTFELAETLNILRADATALLIHRTAVATLVRLHNTRLSTIRKTVEAAVHAASLLKEIGKETDLSLPVLAHIVRTSGAAAKRKKALLNLIARHRGAALTKKTLSALVNGPDFDVGLTAATEGLGVEPLRYCRFCVEKLPRTDAVKAIPVFLRNAVPGAEAYLLGHLCRGEEPEITGAIVAALVENGSSVALGPLYAFSKDEHQPLPLRGAAADAVAAIRSRLGVQYDGRLSLAGENAREGGLSMAEGGDEAGGGLSIHENAEDEPLSGDRD